MKLFYIYVKKSLNQTIDDVVVIKNGFSFFAFTFNIFWFLQHKMWKKSVVLFCINIILGFIASKHWFDGMDILITELGLIVIIGLNANYWYEKKLLKENYQFFGCAYSNNENEAKLKFFSGLLDAKDKSNIFGQSIFNYAKKQVTKYFSV
jgi:hypothetical protein